MKRFKKTESKNDRILSLCASSPAPLLQGPNSFLRLTFFFVVGVWGARPLIANVRAGLQPHSDLCHVPIMFDGKKVGLRAAARRRLLRRRSCAMWRRAAMTRCHRLHMQKE
jgi:hypothetical protein